MFLLIAILLMRSASPKFSKNDIQLKCFCKLEKIDLFSDIYNFGSFKINTSILLLKTSRPFADALLNVPASYLTHNFQISRTVLSYSFKSFLKFDINNLKLDIHKSQFTHSLSSAVFLSGLDIGLTTQNKQKVFSSITKVKIHDCIFENCQATNDEKSGGAIYAEGDFDQKSTMIIMNTGFSKCFAIDHSGAIFAHLHRFDIFNSCFDNCSAGKRFFAISIDSEKTKSNSTIFSYCHAEKEHGSHCIGFERNHLALRNLNVTHIGSDQKGTALSAKHVEKMEVVLSIFTDISGDSLIHISSLSTHIVFKESTINTDTDYLFFTSTTVNISDSILMKSYSIAQKSDEYLSCVVNCLINSDENEFRMRNRNSIIEECQFFSQNDTIETITYQIDNFHCWDKGVHVADDELKRRREAYYTKILTILFKKIIPYAIAVGIGVIITLLIINKKKKPRVPKALLKPKDRKKRKNRGDREPKFDDTIPLESAIPPLDSSIPPFDSAIPPFDDM